MVDRPSGATHRGRVWISVWDWFCDRSYSLWGRKQWTRRTHRHCGKALAPMCWSPCPPEGRLREGFANVAALPRVAEIERQWLTWWRARWMVMLWTGKLCAAHATTTVSLAIYTPTLACVQIGGLHVFTAARFFIDVWSASERALTMSVRNLADASRCPSITALPSFARISQKHHTSLSKDLIRASLGFICRWLFGKLYFVLLGVCRS